jgi:gluconolactonase
MVQAQEDGFAALVSPEAKVTKIVEGRRFTEGPVWIDRDGGYLIFSDIPADEMFRWNPRDGSLTSFRKPSHNTNGNILDREGRLLSCEHSARVVSITDLATGAYRVLIERADGKRFNSPNDVVVKSDGTIWFTDPPYGLPKDQAKEMTANNVFRHNPSSGRTAIVVSDFDMPNGLCFSPDERRLYVADSGKPKHIRVFDVNADGTVSNGRLFCDIDKGVPDGIRCDERGNLWSSAGDGVQVFAPDGKLRGRILVPQSAANLCFGGADGKTLFITAQTSVYSIPVNVRPATRP